MTMAQWNSSTGICRRVTRVVGQQRVRTPTRRIPERARMLRDALPVRVQASASKTTRGRRASRLASTLCLKAARRTLSCPAATSQCMMAALPAMRGAPIILPISPALGARADGAVIKAPNLATGRSLVSFGGAWTNATHTVVRATRMLSSTRMRATRAAL